MFEYLCCFLVGVLSVIFIIADSLNDSPQTDDDDYIFLPAKNFGPGSPLLLDAHRAEIL